MSFCYKITVPLIIWNIFFLREWIIFKSLVFHLRLFYGMEENGHEDRILLFHGSNIARSTEKSFLWPRMLSLPLLLILASFIASNLDWQKPKTVSFILDMIRDRLCQYLNFSLVLLRFCFKNLKKLVLFHFFQKSNNSW